MKSDKPSERNMSPERCCRHGENAVSDEDEESSAKQPSNVVEPITKQLQHRGKGSEINQNASAPRWVIAGHLHVAAIPEHSRAVCRLSLADLSTLHREKLQTKMFSGKAARHVDQSMSCGFAGQNKQTRVALNLIVKENSALPSSFVVVASEKLSHALKTGPWLEVFHSIQNSEDVKVAPEVWLSFSFLISQMVGWLHSRHVDETESPDDWLRCGLIHLRVTHMRLLFRANHTTIRRRNWIN